jgi:hypothetical protein
MAGYNQRFNNNADIFVNFYSFVFSHLRRNVVYVIINKLDRRYPAAFLGSFEFHTHERTDDMSAFNGKKRKNDSNGMFINDQHSSKDLPKKDGKRDIQTRLFVIVSIAILVIFVALVFYNSGILNKYTQAIDANGHKVTTSELSFYYKYQYNNFINQYSSYLDFIGLDTDKDLDEQECSSQKARLGRSIL